MVFSNGSGKFPAWFLRVYHRRGRRACGGENPLGGGEDALVAVVVVGNVCCADSWPISNSVGRDGAPYRSH